MKKTSKKITKPTPEDRNSGLKHKYNVTHADGSPVDPKGQYFILRLDYHKNCDKRHIAACRSATLQYIASIDDHLPLLADDLREVLGITRRSSQR